MKYYYLLGMNSCAGGWSSWTQYARKRYNISSAALLSLFRYLAPSGRNEDSKESLPEKLSFIFFSQYIIWHSTGYQVLIGGQTSSCLLNTSLWQYVWWRTRSTYNVCEVRFDTESCWYLVDWDTTTNFENHLFHKPNIKNIHVQGTKVKTSSGVK